LPLATVDAVQALLLRDLTEVEALYFPALAGMADATIAGYLPGIALDEGDATVTVRTEGNRVWLPLRPVSLVTEVIVGTTTLAPEGYRWWGSGRIDIYGIVAGDEVVVSYSYGPAPASVAAVAAQLVAARYQQPTDGVKQESEQVGPYSRSVTYATDGPGPMALTDVQLRALRRYRRSGATVIEVEGDGVRYGRRRWLDPCRPT
jgi:hypothetical protein